MKSTRQAFLVFGDIVCFIVGFLGFALIGYDHHPFHETVTLHAFPFAIITLLWIVVMFIFNFYELRASKPNLVFLRNFFIAGIIMLGVGFIFFYINPITRISPKSNLIIFESISLLLILGWRRMFYMATRDAFHTRFAIVCSEEKFHGLVSEITKHPHLGFENRGTFKTLNEFFQAQPHIDLLIIHKTDEHETHLLEQVLASQVEVIDLPEAYETILYKIPVDFIDNQWIIRSITKGSDFFYRTLSRIVSILFAIVVGILTLPISLVIIIAIKIEDRGPIFIRQTRTGLHGKIFKLYKFRSMIVLGADGQAETQGNAVWATGDKDPRITKVGRITRKLHIDEIAQMINILKGDLALVGPRPERPEFVAQLERDIPYYFMRHTITPGFTGWAQIKFRYARSVMDSQEKFEYDLFYLKNRNFFLDIGIILKTVQIIFTH
jgi:exopolysaccharide biosynthesis polyprenyl glycosylphosphotransferase